VRVPVCLSTLPMPLMVTSSAFSTFQVSVALPPRPICGGVAEKQLHLELDVPADLRLEADQIKLARILYNLVHNAVKFTPPGGRIVVRGRQEGDWFRLDVSDTGIGIAPEDQAHLFKQFVRLDDSSGRREVGIGLGLAVCHRLVSLHGGTITVESEPGKGSTFTVRIPRRCPATAPTP